MTTTDRALCATLLPIVGDLWFSTDHRDRARAKAYCRACPLMASCAQAGLDAGDKARGVWGGLSSGDRRVIRTGRLDGPDPDDFTDAADDTGAVPVLARQSLPCGTLRALRAHGRYAETCEVCEAAQDARVDAARRQALAEEHGKGGTARGWEIHRRLRERECPHGCRAAWNTRQAVRRAAARMEGAAGWARRTGQSGGPQGARRGVGAAA